MKADHPLLQSLYYILGTILFLYLLYLLLNLCIKERISFHYSASFDQTVLMETKLRYLGFKPSVCLKSQVC